LTLSYVPNQLDHNRYGFIVSKRIGKATRRNHVRRWLREALRQRDPQIGYRGNPQENAALGCNIVLIARPSLAEATYQQLQEAVDELLRRAGLLPA
jgi:ribonuclease P protein component